MAPFKPSTTATALILLILMTIGFRCHSQFTWQVTAGDIGPDVGYCIYAEDGYTYAAGWFEGISIFGPFTLSSHGGSDIFILKIAPGGQILWAQNFGGISEDRIYGLSSNGNGNLFLSGSFSKTAVFGSKILNSQGSDDVFLCSLSTSGTVNWAINAGGSGSDIAYRVNVSPDGNYIAFAGHYQGDAIFGTTTYPGLSGRDLFIANVNADGEYQWVFTAPGFSDESGYAVDFDDNGNLWATSYFYFTDLPWSVGDTLLHGYGQTDCALMKIDQSGKLIFAKAFGGLADDLPRVLKYHNGYLYIGGYHNGNGNFLNKILPGLGNRDAFVVRANMNGEASWATGGLSYGDDELIGLDTDPAGNVYVAGYFSEVMMAENIVIWSHGLLDAVSLKLNGNTGHYEQAVTGGGPNNDIFYGVSLKHPDTLLLAGYFMNEAYFDNDTLHSAGDKDILFFERPQSLNGNEVTSDKGRLLVFPNPASNRFYCKIVEPIETPLTLTDGYGRKVRSFDLTPGTTMTIDCSDLPAGIYFLNRVGSTHPPLKVIICK